MTVDIFKGAPPDCKRCTCINGENLCCKTFLKMTWMENGWRSMNKKTNRSRSQIKCAF